MRVTPETLSQAEALASVLSNDQMADWFGVHRSTFYERIKAHPELADAIAKGKARALASIGTSLLTKARAGDNACMMFYLKTQGGWRESHRLEVENTNAPAAPDLSKLTEEERALYLQLCLKGSV